MNRLNGDAIRLEEFTQDFYLLHWCCDQLPTPPRWKSWAPFLYGSAPYWQEGGCYALFAGPTLVYIGLGASKGGGRYLKCGISRRMMAHVYCSANKSDPKVLKLRDNWSGVTEIQTLGLGDRDYLAPALESFLIRALSPSRNRRV